MSLYTFALSWNKKSIYITNDREEIQPYTIDTLRFMAGSPGLPPPVRDMAREALEFAGLPVAPESEPRLASDTLTDIRGVKVYQDLRNRKFFFLDKKGRIHDRRRLSNLERDIRGMG